jgi:hypothetical protein
VARSRCFTPSRSWRAGRRARNVESLGFHTLGSAFFKTKRHSRAVDFPQEVRVLLGIVLDQEPPRGIRIVARCPVSGRPWDTLGRRQFPSQVQSDARRCVLRINVRLLSGGRELPIDRIRMTVSKQFEVYRVEMVPVRRTRYFSELTWLRRNRNGTVRDPSVRTVECDMRANCRFSRTKQAIEVPF